MLKCMGPNVWSYRLCQVQKVLRRKLTTADPYHREQVPFKIDFDLCEDASSSRCKIVCELTKSN